MCNIYLTSVPKAKLKEQSRSKARPHCNIRHSNADVGADKKFDDGRSKLGKGAMQLEKSTLNSHNRMNDRASDYKSWNAYEQQLTEHNDATNYF